MTTIKPKAMDAVLDDSATENAQPETPASEGTVSRSNVSESTVAGGPSGSYTAADISILKGLEAVRKRPGMYVQGGTGIDGYHQLLTEIIDNAIDEGLAGFANEVHVIMHADGSATVTDNGRGIPVDIMKSEGRSAIEVIFTELHAGGKFGQGAYKVSGGLHGVGSSVVNALSSYLDVTVNKDGKLHHIRFERGDVVTPLEVLGDTPADVTWATQVSFHPDAAVFSEFTNLFDYDRIRRRLRELAYLTGLKIVIRDERTELHAGDVKEETFYEQGGIANFARALVTDDSKLLYDQPIVMRGTHSDVEVEVAFIHANTYNSDNILTYANMIRTRDGGTPLTGLKTAYTRILNKYASDKNLIKNGNPIPTGDDLLEGIYCVVSVKLGEPQFESQAKVKLLNSEAQTAVKPSWARDSRSSSKKTPKSARPSWRRPPKAARAREAARKARDIVRRSNPWKTTTCPASWPTAPRGPRRIRTLYRGRQLGRRQRQGWPRAPLSGHLATARQNPERREVRTEQDPEKRRNPGADRGHRCGCGGHGRPDAHFNLSTCVTTNRDHDRRRHGRRAHPHAAADLLLPVHAPAGRAGHTYTWPSRPCYRFTLGPRERRARTCTTKKP